MVWGIIIENFHKVFNRYYGIWETWAQVQNVQLLCWYIWIKLVRLDIAHTIISTNFHRFFWLDSQRRAHIKTLIQRTHCLKSCETIWCGPVPKQKQTFIGNCLPLCHLCRKSREKKRKISITNWRDRPMMSSLRIKKKYVKKNKQNKV